MKREQTSSSSTYVDPLDKVMHAVKAKVTARVPMIWLVSDEEQRIQEKLATQVCFPLQRDICLWSQSKGIIDYKGKTVEANARHLSQAIEFIKTFNTTSRDSRGTVFILQDAHYMLTPQVARQLRDLYVPLQIGQPSDTAKATTILFLSGRVGYVGNGIVEGLEPSLQNSIDILDIPLPTKQNFLEQITSTLNRTKEKSRDNNKVKLKLDYTKDELYSFASSLQGLTIAEGLRVISECLNLHKGIVVDTLQEKKKQLVRRGGLLEVVDQLPSLDQVGGLDEVKKYVSLYIGQFTEEAIKFGLEPLKALLFTGIPGTGKSLCSKALAATWKVPCLRLDMGKIMQGVVGSSEANIRLVIKIAEAAAPCVLWIDEIEKQMSGTASSNFSDSGTTARVFGTLLTAMEEGLAGVCITATANDIQALPPELIRRFDETFYVDLPVTEERRAILPIHLGKRGRNPSLFAVEDLVKATHGFTGSEIEKMVKVGLAIAWQQQKELSNEHLFAAIKEMRPISKIMAGAIEKSREWAKGRARPASKFVDMEGKGASNNLVDLSTSINLADLTGDVINMTGEEGEKN